jgi:hypothetical protein
VVAEVPYETASELFETLTRLPFSDPIVHEVVGEVSDRLTVLSVSPTKKVGLAGSTSAPSGHVGKGTGRKPKAFAFTWWIVSRLCTY